MGKANDKKIKDLPAKERLLLLRINHRRGSEEGKRLQGKVSEAKTDFKNTLHGKVPDDGEEAKAVLRKLQLLDEEVTSRKGNKSGFKQRVKDTQKALLYAEISEGGQLVLPGAELELAPENLRELKLGIADVRLQDQAAKADSDSEPSFPIEDKADLSALDADLDRFIAAAGISAASLGAAPTKDEAKAESAAKGGRRGGKDAPVSALPH